MLVGLYITGAYCLRIESFANPAVTIARALTQSFAASHHRPPRIHRRQLLARWPRLLFCLAVCERLSPQPLGSMPQ